ncbi:unnamed protein product, partial [Scytosiphon promiscuus]
DASCCCAEETCGNGVAGSQSDEVCCAPGCGTCGGAGCGSRPGGSVSWCMLSTRATTVVVVYAHIYE